MKIKLICPASHYLVLVELLKTRGIEVADESPYCLADSSLPVPPADLTILFDSRNPKPLLDFFDKLPPEKEKTNSGTVIGRKGESYFPLRIEDIYYCEADGNTVYFQTKLNRYEIAKKLYEVEETLAGSGFVRINKSCIVNILMVAEIFQWFRGKLLLKLTDSQTELEVSRFYVKHFKEFLGL